VRFSGSEKERSHLQAQFYRLKARRGPKKAIMAVVASILTAIYHVLKDGTIYQDLGQAPLRRPAKKAPGQALVRARYAVELKPLAA
jgi:transposase